METILNSPADAARRAAKDAQKIGSDLRNDFDDVVGRSRDTANDLRETVRGAAEDAAASGRDIAQDAVRRGRKRLGEVTERVTAYADDNTAIVAAVAFGIGLLTGYLASRR